MHGISNVIINNPLYLYLTIINIVTFIVLGIDKLLAMMYKQRVSERILFVLSVLGGCFLELIGMFVFRHKIRKISFYFINIVMIIVYIDIIYYL